MRAAHKALAALGITLAAGCQDPVEPDELAQGLTVIEAKDDSLAVAYRKDDAVIYFHALRGRATPEPYQQDPGSPKFEVDARIVADNGRIFFVQRGGDDFIDPTWAEDLAGQDALPPTRVSNAVLFELAGEAADHMDLEIAAQLGDVPAATIAPQLDALRTIAAQAPSTYATMKDAMLAYRGEHGLPAVDEVEYGSAGPESPDVAYPGGYYWNVNVFQGDIENSPAGYHSSVRIHRWDGYWAVANDFCNHGRCPGEGGMNSSCYAQWDAPVGSDLKPAWTAFTCNTGYALYSDDGGHNCHDDTRLLTASFVYGNGHQADPGSAYWCNGQDDDTDISVNIWGWEIDHSGYPQCDANVQKGYQHPHTCTSQNQHGYNAAAGCYCDQACLTYNDCCIDGPY